MEAWCAKARRAAWSPGDGGPAHVAAGRECGHDGERKLRPRLGENWDWRKRRI